jgi:hypothetical protein
MLSSRVNVVGTTKEDIKVPIPCKLVGFYEALEKNFDWIYPENPFMKVVNQRVFTKDLQKLIWIQYKLLLRRLLQLILMLHLKILDLHFLRLAQRH